VTGFANRVALDRLLGQIDRNVLTLAGHVAHGVDVVTQALLEGDVATCDDIILHDDDIDLLALTTEDLCLEALVTQQPVASDLRAVVASLHMITDLERSADLVANIAKAAGRLQGAKPDDRIRELILRMSSQASQLFFRARTALEQRDVKLADSITDLDDVLDELHHRFIEVVLKAAGRGDLLPQHALQLAMVGRFYERIGDHAENLGERIHYLVTGWLPERQAAERAKARQTGEAVPEVRARGLAVIDAVSEERRVDAIRRDFVANVSHELKTPVGAISLLAETIADETDDDNRRRLVGHLTREVDRLERIIDDLLELSRLEDDQRPRVEKLSLDTVVGESVDTVRGLARQRGIDIVLSGVPSGIELHANHRQLVRALVCLVDNAVRYSDEGNQVWVGIDRTVDNAEVSVRDTGSGIPRADLERIFERFYRVDRARSRETGGTGLGLAIVRHVAENHGGRVLVESKLGEGSTFTLQLPIT
jgi:phosphate transport system regulatory protein PhoU